MKDTERRLARFNRQRASDADVRKNDQMLMSQADYISRDPNIPLRSIIEGLFQTIHEKANLLGKEFIEKFRENYIAGIIENNFVCNLKDDDTKRNPEGKYDREMELGNPNDQEFLEAKKELTNFLGKYLSKSGTTLSSHIEGMRALYPNVNFFQVFDKDLKEKLRERIESASEKMVNKQTRIIFEGNEEEENPEKKQKEFILDFFFRRVLNVDGHGKLFVNDESMWDLVDFLDSCNYDLEQLYMIVYEEFREMTNIQEVSQKTRLQVERVMGGTVPPNNMAELQREILAERYYSFMGKDFDFDNFFKLHIYPHIMEIRKRHLPPEKYMRLVDVTKVEPKAMAENIAPRGAIKPVVRKLYEIEESEEAFLHQCRQYFNYLNMDDSLTDQEMLDLLSGQLEKAKELIEEITADGIRMRDPEDPINEDCRFIPEIINCRDLKKLVAWLTSPELFLEEYPEYDEKYSNKKRIIAHQVRKMLELLLLYRRHIFDEKFKQAEEKRTNLEDHFSKILNIQNRHEVEIPFRVMVPVNDRNEMKMVRNEKGDQEPAYEITYDEKVLKEKPQETNIQEIDGIRYQIFPIETKKFMEVEVDIPNGKDGKTVHAKLLIYTGNQRPKDLIHCKGWKSFLSSILRGKEPTDIIRWSIVVANPEARDAIRNFIYENYSSGGTRKITDQVEDRHLNQKGERPRTSGSKMFDKQREFISATYATLPSKKDGNVEHTHVEFETQLNGLDSMLIYNLSDHTVSSHSRVYTPEREFENLFKYFFPPVIYGQEFANYKLQGYNYKMPANDNNPEPDEE